MMGLPEGETFDFLRGRTLEQVCFGQHQLQLRFDERVTVAVEGAIAVREPGLVEELVEDARDVASSVLSLLGLTVAQIRLPDTKNLILEFDNGTTVRVIDSEARYESFQVHSGDQIILV